MYIQWCIRNDASYSQYITLQLTDALHNNNNNFYGAVTQTTLQRAPHNQLAVG